MKPVSDTPALVVLAPAGANARPTGWEVIFAGRPPAGRSVPERHAVPRWFEHIPRIAVKDRPVLWPL